MTIQVNVTCAWCLTTVTTTLENPVPKDWVGQDVKNPSLEGPAMIRENFCTKEHADSYDTVALECHDAASLDYTAKFYSTMNEKREAAQ